MSEYKLVLEFCKLLIDLSKARGNYTILKETQFALNHYVHKYDIDAPIVLDALNKMSQEMEHKRKYARENEAKKRQFKAKGAD